MGIEDRDWYREDRKRRQGLAGNDYGETGLAAISTQLRRWRRRNARWAIRDLVRWGLLAVALYAVWSLFRG